MIPVYIAESSLDAQLVQDLLVGAGIAAHVLRPGVASRQPDEPGLGKTRVVVEDGEERVARALIADWESGAPEEEEFDLLDSLPLGDAG